ncbi:NMDA receptor-regulated protein 1a [Laetiporus sulphureus 93-53]|uniref:NMDA receptor-regulated protein 1a n=1 Tax=Laetiporus sulphureus 93-53 TaxID=1314785 RepID=A0A165BAY1_9APHY|nr:NMDA receptor-regulated protein 1a [Laetiporus sulphureus 93-53]KZT00643.1 NMDA receptor-regulated protein 1a [Laetiporus sulphureus 93-53]
MPPAGIPPKRALPSKEATLFKELLNLYETRQLKKGLKTADQIVKKFPEHGETLCMKGLILTHMGRREEGLELVKKGIRLDLTSHICWHVFGLIQKGEKNYEEALKSYTQALKFDKENLNILRDAAHLQTQLRIFDGLVETRLMLLRLRPSLRQNWIGLAVAYHLNGNLDEARKVLEQYEATLKNVPDYDVEHSEVLLYHVRILEEIGSTSEALALLDVNAKSRAIIDRMAIMEFRARLLSKLGDSEAEHTWRALIEQNPDCHDYYRGFLLNRGIDFDAISDENREAALQCLEDFSTQLPRAAAPRRLALSIAVGDKFNELIEPYLMSGLEKGIPSLFADVKALYRDLSKQQAIETIVEAFRDKFAPAAEPQPTSSDPTTYLWTLYFLAQHHSYLHRHTKALELLDVAILHTPTLPELHMFKGRVLKWCGNPIGAARCLDEARILDLQDRCLNTKCAKYRMRAGFIDEASDILGLFTKKDAPSPGADLEDMQSLLYLTEEGDAHLRKGNLGMALKRYTAVQKVFDELEDDQFDFHGYSLRKFTINVYLELIVWEDHLRSHPAYVHTAIAASKIYVRLHDNPSLTSTLTSNGTLTDAEKKAKKKAKKAAQKVHEEVKKANANVNEDKGLELPAPKDDDPDGAKLLQASDPLEKAAKFLAPLRTLAKDNIDAWIATYDVAVRRKKYIQAVKALNSARAVNAEDPELHVRLVHFRTIVASLPQSPPAPMGPVVSEALTKLLPEELSLELYNSQYLQRHSTDARAILACAKVSHLLQAPRGEVEDATFAVLNPDVKLDIKTSLAVHDFLKDLQSPRADELRTACDKRFELSTVFKLPSETSSLQWNAAETDAVTGGADKAEVVG